MTASPFKRSDKVAIVGFATSSRDLAPYGDESFEVWSLNEAYSVVPRWDRWFEMHARELYYESFSDDNPRTKGHLDWLKAQTKPVFMAQRYDDIPASIAYPYDTMAAHFGIAYFTNSIAYMLALAIYEGYAEVHVYGVDMLMGDEYAYQRSCCDFWVGIALGQGRRVYVPKESALLKGSYLYGREPEPTEGVISESMIANRLGAYQQQHGQAAAALYRTEGAIQELSNLHTAVKHGKLGGTGGGLPMPAPVREGPIAIAQPEPAPVLTDGNGHAFLPPPGEQKVLAEAKE